MSDEQPLFSVRKSDLVTYVLFAAVAVLGLFVFLGQKPKDAIPPSMPVPHRCPCGPRCGCQGTGTLVAPAGALTNEQQHK